MKKVYLFFSAMLLVCALQAQIIHVPGDFSTIQQGIIAANPGDTVLVDEGIYYEQISFLGKKPLMVASRLLMDGDTSHISNTIIDGSQITNSDTGSVVLFTSGEDTTSILYGFTVRNGTRGTKFEIPGYPDCRAGGGIYLAGSGARIMWNRIMNNSIDASSVGGSVVIGGGIGSAWDLVSINWAVIDHNTISNNSVTYGSYQAGGGGISICGNARVSENTITGNQALCSGSALAFGGGLFIGYDRYYIQYRYAIVTNNVIGNNTIQSQQLTVPVGGGCAFQSNVTLFTGNIVEDNSAFSNLDLASGGGVRIDGPRSGTTIKNNTFRDNVVDGNGGALSVQYYPQYHEDTARIVDNYFLHNTGENGGGIHVDKNLAVIHNNVFSGNHSNNWGGAAFVIDYVTGDVEPMAFFANNSFYGNSAANAGGAVFSFKGKPVIVNSVFWNDSSNISMGPEIGVSTAADVLFGMPGSGDTLEIASSDVNSLMIRGPWKDGGNNFSQDPLFRNTDSLTVEGNSPCIDSGTDNYTSNGGINIAIPRFDILGISRPRGSGTDLGAYERFEIMPGFDDIAHSGLKAGNYPNPFDRSTTIFYSLPDPAMVTVTILDVFGRVVDEPVKAQWQSGPQEIRWNPGDHSSGIYVLRFDVGGQVFTKMMVRQ